MINKKRIKKFYPNAQLLRDGQSFIIGVLVSSIATETLNKLGFTKNLEIGESILPPSIGPISDFNANGKYIKHTDKPMEIAYRTSEWHWTEWHGRYDRVEKSKIVDIPYRRYQRTLIAPPSLEITIIQDNKGNKILASSILKYKKEDDQNLAHVANLFLEIFGVCNFFTENLDEIIKIPIKKLNWNILPPGTRPWEKLKTELSKLIDSTPTGKKPVIEYRLSAINSFKPNFVAYGVAGFHGYIVFGFEGLKYYILENLTYGNATYIFDENWEKFSQMTKAQVINEDLEEDRITHHENWQQQIKTFFEKNLPPSERSSQ